MMREGYRATLGVRDPGCLEAWLISIARWSQAQDLSGRLIGQEVNGAFRSLADITDALAHTDTFLTDNALSVKSDSDKAVGGESRDKQVASPSREEIARIK